MTAMNAKPTPSARQPFCGADLEHWRVANGLSKVSAADAFGLQKAKFEALIARERCREPITDPVVCMLLHLYREHPEAAPIQKTPDLAEFYGYLGFGDSPQDRETFAALIGRTPPSVYRLLLHNGTPGRPVMRWVEAVRRLDLDAKKAMMVMADVVSSVGEHQGVDKPLLKGWGQQKTDSDPDPSTD
jgi:hypothetical protein